MYEIRWEKKEGCVTVDVKYGPVSTKDMQNPLLRRGHLDIKDAQRNVLKIKMNVKFHITSYRVWAQ